MRFWLSGPRLFGGLIRPGISFGMPRYRFGPPQAREPVDYVYVIEGSHGLVKIGKSNDPDVRLATLQTGSAHLLRIASVTVVPIAWVSAVERTAQDLLASHRGNGEWFAVSPNVAVAAVYAAGERLGVDLTAQQEAEEIPLKRRLSAAAITILILAGAMAAVALLPVMVGRILAVAAVLAIIARRLIRFRPRSV